MNVRPLVAMVAIAFGAFELGRMVSERDQRKAQIASSAEAFQNRRESGVIMALAGRSSRAEVLDAEMRDYIDRLPRYDLDGPHFRRTCQILLSMSEELGKARGAVPASAASA